MTTYRPDERVDITIRGAVVDYHFDPAGGDYVLVVSIPGCETQLDIPMADDQGGRLPAVTVTRVDIISTAPAADDGYVPGSDYHRDPAARMAAIREIAPEFVQLVQPAIPEGPGQSGRNLYLAANAVIDEHGLPRYSAMGSAIAATGQWWLRLRTEDDRQAWARTLGLTGTTGNWGTGTITLRIDNECRWWQDGGYTCPELIHPEDASFPFCPRHHQAREALREVMS